jgi:hypothetical protein
LKYVLYPLTWSCFLYPSQRESPPAAEGVTLEPEKKKGTDVKNAHSPASVVLLALLALGLIASPARADFMEIPSGFSGAEKFFLAKATGVPSFDGFVGLQGPPAPEVHAVAGAGTVTVDIADGWATIKPDTGLLTALTFTPVNPNGFDDFLSRGQLAADGSVTITVQDNQGHAPQSFTFSGLKANQDFGFIGIIATAGSGETIQSVKIEANAGNSFNEVKQVEFSEATAVPEPASLAMFGFGAIGLIGYAWRRRQLPAA